MHFMIDVDKKYSVLCIKPVWHSVYQSKSSRRRRRDNRNPRRKGFACQIHILSSQSNICNHSWQLDSRWIRIFSTILGKTNKFLFILIW